MLSRSTLVVPARPMSSLVIRSARSHKPPWVMVATLSTLPMLATHRYLLARASRCLVAHIHHYPSIRRSLGRGTYRLRHRPSLILLAGLRPQINHLRSRRSRLWPLLTTHTPIICLSLRLMARITPSIQVMDMQVTCLRRRTPISQISGHLPRRLQTTMRSRRATIRIMRTKSLATRNILIRYRICSPIILRNSTTILYDSRSELHAYAPRSLSHTHHHGFSLSELCYAKPAFLRLTVSLGPHPLRSGNAPPSKVASPLVSNFLPSYTNRSHLRGILPHPSTSLPMRH